LYTKYQFYIIYCFAYDEPQSQYEIAVGEHFEGGLFGMRIKKQCPKTLLITLLGVAIPSLTIARAGNAEWSYSGSTNPTKWHELNSEYQTCETGNRQSPINIQASDIARRPSGNIDFNYSMSDLEVVNNGHTIKVNYDAGSSITLDGETYELKQFHFHTPSEHWVNGEAAAMELHLVHQNNAGEIAVVGVLIKSGSKNPQMAQVWSNIPGEGETKASKTMVDASKFLPENRNYYRYSGSLTTPPCSEGVKWVLFETPIEASPEQIEAFANLYPSSARPIQDTNNRSIMEML
jgi:carbonic anhydrase